MSKWNKILFKIYFENIQREMGWVRAGRLIIMVKKNHVTNKTGIIKLFQKEK